MSSFLLIVTVGCLLPACLFYPQIGLLVWGWLSLMSPHQEIYGFAQGLQFNLVVSVVTLVGWLLSREPKLPPASALTVAVILFVLLMGIAQLTSAYPEYSWQFFMLFLKSMVFILLCMALMTTKARIHAMLWIYAISLAYYGVKGGGFTLVTGGAYHAVGPPNTMIADNNQFGVALVMALPVLFYLRLQTANRMIRLGLLVAICLTALCVLGTQSRGAFVGLAVMSGVLLWRSRHRGIVLVGLVLLAVPAIAFMPEAWHVRMATIENPGEDASFMGRVDAWRIAFEIALADPLTGGGFRVGYIQHIADRYTGGAYVARAHHSIYFEILAAMGFLGLAFFLLILALTWRNAAWLRRHTRGRPELRWAYDLASMMQAGLAGYVVAGATLSLEFWPGYWIIVPLLLHARRLVEAQDRPIAAERGSSNLTAGALPRAVEPPRP